MNRGIGLESVKKLIYAPYTTSKMNLLKMLMGKKPSKPNLVFGVFGWMVKRVVRSWGIIGWIFALYFYTKN